MMVTHKDIINFLHEYTTIPKRLYILHNGMMIFKYDIQYSGYKHQTLPPGIVHHAKCDLWRSNVTELPDDIVLNGSLSVCDTTIKEINVDIGQHLDVRNCPAVLKDGIYIGGVMWSTIYEISGTNINDVKVIDNPPHKYAHLDRVRIGGYLFNTGIIS